MSHTIRKSSTTPKELNVTQRPNTLATGVPRLDILLGGGIVRNSMVLIVGSSGVGKTVLANQIAWTAAHNGDPVVIVTAFSEPHHKLIANLEHFEFFQRSYIGERIRMINVQHQLISSLDAAADTILREARDHNAGVVLIDGFHRVRLSSQDPAAPYQFLWDLGAKLHLLGVTTIVMYEMYNMTDASLAEYMLADTVITLAQQTDNHHVTRTLQVVKHRGRHALSGRHTFTLDDTGIRCYPRQEALPLVADIPVSEERISTGLAPFDALLGGGVPQGSTTLLIGPTGTGKTTFSLHYALAGIAQSQPTLFVTFSDNSQHLIARGKNLNIQGSNVQQLSVRSYTLGSLDPDIVANELREVAKQQPGMRIILDGVQHLTQSISGTRHISTFFAALVNGLHAHGATLFLTADSGWGADQAHAANVELATLADNIVELHYGTASPHNYALSVVKMRLSDHQRTPQPYNIDANGIIFDTDDSATA